MNSKAPHRARTRLLALLMALSLFPMARASELLRNGDFELGSKFFADDWNGDWQHQTSTNTPISGMPAPAPFGTYAVMADQWDGAAGSHFLYQDFTAPSDLNTFLLTFQLYVDSQTAYTANQRAQVDLVTANASQTVLMNIFTTSPGYSVPGYALQSKDLSNVIAAGGTYRLLFSEFNNAGYLRAGVDNVSLAGTFIQPPPPVDPGPGPDGEVPEPASFVLLGGGLVALGVGRKLRARA